MCISILRENLSFYLEYEIQKVLCFPSNSIENNILEEFYSCFESFLDFILIDDKNNSGKHMSVHVAYYTPIE